MTPGGTETAGSALCGFKFIHNFKGRLNNRNDDQLGNSFHGFNGKRLLRAIPAGDHQFSLIVGINKSDQVAEHDAVFMTEAGTGQD